MPTVNRIPCSAAARQGELPRLLDVALGSVAVRKVPHATRWPRPSFNRELPTCVAHVCMVALSLALWWVSLHAIDLQQISDIGLLSVLPLTFFVALGLLTVSFLVALRRLRAGWLLVLHVTALILLLHAIPSVVESVPRVNAAWRHVGIIDYIGRTGTVQPPIDAYFSWPAFFSYGALLVPIAGQPNALMLARWAPPVFDLLYLAPLLVILSALTPERRVVWLACWCFFLANWTGQDYFSPQSFTFFLYLAVLALLLHCFRPRSKVTEATVDKSVGAPRGREFVDDPTDVGPRTQVVAIATIVLAAAVTIASHQLTPFALLASVSALAMTRRISLRGLPLIFAIMTGAWLMFVALAYLRGHITLLASNVGDLGQNVNAGVSSRMQGSAGHLFVVRVRVVLSGIVWVVAAVAVARRIRHRTVDVACLCLALGPFVLVAAQPYGGEILLRVYLFSLPFMSFFAGTLFTSASERIPSFGRIAVVGVLSGALGLGLVVSKYGNENGEYFTTSDVQAVDGLYAAAGPRSLLVAVTPSVPWKNRHYEWTYEIVSESREWDSVVSKTPSATTILPWLKTKIQEHHADEALLIIDRSQVEFAHLLGLAPDGWISTLEIALTRSPALTTVYRNADASVFRVEGTT